MGINKFIYVVTYVVHKAPKNHVKQNINITYITSSMNTQLIKCNIVYY